MDRDRDSGRSCDDVGPLQEAGKVRMLVDPLAFRRLLVLTDAGEEIDDEAALWILIRHLCENPELEADVVFVTGNTMQRAMRWGSIISTSEEGAAKPRPGQLRYFLGPCTERHVRYPGDISEAELGKAGMTDLGIFAGGEYDVILQLSPLGGFCMDPNVPPAGVESALLRVGPRPGVAHESIVLIVGGEGSTNFPMDELHVGWKAFLKKAGFWVCHVTASNYVRWTPQFFSHMLPKQVDLVMADEWNKAVGRIPPSTATLMVRFRVNCQPNYDLVKHAYAGFCSMYGASPAFTAAIGWRKQFSVQIWDWIVEGYIRQSREADAAKGQSSQGNATIVSSVPKVGFTWDSIMSEECKSDVREALEGEPARPPLPSLLVDEALGRAVHLTTMRVLTIAAYDAFANGSGGTGPDMGQVRAYVLGSDAVPPLASCNFPPFLGDLSAVQREVVGNPNYDASATVLGLAAASASSPQARAIVDALQNGEPLATKEVLERAMMSTMAGCKGSFLLNCLQSDCAQ